MQTWNSKRSIQKCCFRRIKRNKSLKGSQVLEHEFTSDVFISRLAPASVPFKIYGLLSDWPKISSLNDHFIVILSIHPSHPSLFGSSSLTDRHQDQRSGALFNWLQFLISRSWSNYRINRLQILPRAFI